MGFINIILQDYDEEEEFRLLVPEVDYFKINSERKNPN